MEKELQISDQVYLRAEAICNLPADASAYHKKQARDKVIQMIDAQIAHIQKHKNSYDKKQVILALTQLAEIQDRVDKAYKEDKITGLKLY
jgi:hypothetical protein